MAGGAKTTAGPSVMGPAAQQDGPLPGGPTQTAVGRPPRTESRGADEEELDLQKMLEVKRDVRERMAAAMALVDAVILLAEEAVLECEQKRKPALALAGRFVRKGGCGCATCAGTKDQVELVLGLRKLELPDLMQDALTRMTRAGQKVPTMVSIDVELKLEWTLAVWFSQFCCDVILRCAAGVHPSVYCALGAVGTQDRIQWLQSYWGLVLDEHVQVFGTQIAMLAADTLPEELKIGEQCEKMESRLNWSTSEEEEEEDEEDVNGTEGEGVANHKEAGRMAWLCGHMLYSPIFLLCVLASVAGGLWGLCLAVGDLAMFTLKTGGKKLSSGLATVWSCFLFAGVSLPVAAGVFGFQLFSRAIRELGEAVGYGAQLAQQVEDEDEEDVDLVVNGGGVITATQGRKANRSKAFKASSAAGQRRRATVSARKQNKVFDPGIRR